MNLQETSGFDWGNFVGKVFDAVSSERQADRMQELELAKINALATTAGAASETYTEGQSTGQLALPVYLPWIVGGVLAVVGLVLLTR